MATHTYAELPISQAAYDEIRGKMEAAGYNHAFDGKTIDMHGIGLTPAAPVEIPPDFEVTPALTTAVSELVNAFFNDTIEVCVQTLTSEGFPEELGYTLFISEMVRTSAILAVVVRKYMLMGEPNPARWRALTDMAYSRAVAAVEAADQELGPAADATGEAE